VQRDVGARELLGQHGSVPSFFNSTAPDSMICTASARASGVLGSSRTLVAGWSNVPMRRPGTSRRRTRSATRLGGIWPCATASRSEISPANRLVDASLPAAAGFIVPASRPARNARTMLRCATGKSGATAPSKPHSR
jgi:hypothetical protein